MNIEQITSEQTIGEIQHLALDDNMLTTALSKPYADATGLGEVQPSAPVTSDVEEMPSWMTYLLRKMFGMATKVFRGVSLLSEFRAVYNWLRGRLKGSDDGTISAVALDPSKPMSEHLRLLDDRKITNGCSNEVPDGVSLARIMCDINFVGDTIRVGEDKPYIQGNLTELIDTNIWERCTRRLPFWDLKKVRMNCKIITSGVERCLYNGYFRLHQSAGNFSQLEDVEFPYLEWLDNVEGDNFASSCMLIVDIPIKKLHLPKFRGFTNFRMYYLGIAANCPLLEEIDLPSYIGGNMNPGNGDYTGFRNNPELRIIKLNGLENGDLKNCFNDSPKLIHFEIRDGFDAALQVHATLNNTTGWSPAMALRTDTDAEDYVDLREDMTMANNLEQFLWNFQHYIADRVADRTGASALTMTLTSAVYTALQNQSGQTILATLTNKNWTVAQA